jgi:hypothetical protein
VRESPDGCGGRLTVLGGAPHRRGAFGSDDGIDGWPGAVHDWEELGGRWRGWRQVGAGLQSGGLRTASARGGRVHEVR